MTGPAWIIAGWIGVNVLFVAALWLHGRRRVRTTYKAWDESLADLYAAKDALDKSQRNLEAADASTRAAQRELSGYRSAVGDLTANPTTIIIDPYRKAAREAEEAPV